MASAAVAGGWQFNAAPSGKYFDPAVAFGFRYTMTGPAKFTHIQDFPVGLSDAFTVSTADGVLGTFAPGQSVDFTTLAGGGVSSFTVSGITPHADADPAVGFPLQLTFDNPTADFFATPLVPLVGDTNFDSKVDFVDLTRIAQNYNTRGTGAWDTGDFTGDGNVDFADLVIMAQNYNAPPNTGASFESDLATAFATVPEPTALSVIAVATITVAARRRRR
jgi:hypothetical protein